MKILICERQLKIILEYVELSKEIVINAIKKKGAGKFDDSEFVEQEYPFSKEAKVITFKSKGNKIQFTLKVQHIQE